MQRFQRACAYLFSPDHARDPRFLETLDEKMVKQAFRKKAKQYHPDLHGHEARNLRHRRRERFVRIKESYEYLSLKIHDHARPAGHAPQKTREKRPVVIAVGGAKGGIGKSLFAANLAIYLSRCGYRTVAADLDLGGANLHLYLGKTRLRKSVNDFLKKKADTLAQVLEHTAYGPELIGGDSSFLGAGNIGFARKLKLMKAVRKMDADVVVVDLGGDTAFNVLDFFLSADVGVVMTTCDPASYLEAYAFIKVALFRKLNRIFGPESFYSGPVDPVLRRMIREATQTIDNSAVTGISQLRQEVRDKTGSGLRVLDQVLKQYTPFVIVNKAGDTASALPPVQRIQKVCRKSLSIEVPYLGCLPFEPGMEVSARTLVPFVTTPEAAPYAERLKTMTEQLLPF
ncbi:MAG: P-loop NTPase [Desulfobacterales bacterium]|nr:P-loop NTPase [Desulfobacterales bacterium]